MIWTNEPASLIDGKTFIQWITEISNKFKSQWHTFYAGEKTYHHHKTWWWTKQRSENQSIDGRWKKSTQYLMIISGCPRVVVYHPIHFFKSFFFFFFSNLISLFMTSIASHWPLASSTKWTKSSLVIRPSPMQASHLFM